MTNTEGKWIKGITAPVGTVLGPNEANQYFTVAEVDTSQGKVLVRRARISDTLQGQLNGMLGGARSLAEHEFALIRRHEAADAHRETPPTIIIPTRRERRKKR
jgi:hypothetical protein